MTPANMALSRPIEATAGTDHPFDRDIAAPRQTKGMLVDVIAEAADPP
ncbi:MAG: hypothetical protein ACRD0P_02255 [Stackebrandtia sp.]